MKRWASEAEVMAFMEAVFPEGGHLAAAVFDERYVLETATKLITELRATASDAYAQQRNIRAVLFAFDDNIFVRNISRDGDPGWALRCVSPLVALAALKAWAGEK